MIKNKGFEVDVFAPDRAMTQSELIRALKKKPYDAVLSLLTDKIDKKVFASCPSVKIFANYATGFDNIDLIEAKARGIKVTNAPSPLASMSVARHTMALIFALSSRIVEADNFVRKGKYKGWAPMIFIGQDLNNKTLGLIGLGHIGEAVAQYARSMGMKVVYYDVNRNKQREESGISYVDLDTLIKTSDVISIHVPLLESTHHLIDLKKLSMMKSTALLVNTSRGPVVDEKALVKVLKKGKIAGAGLDVFEFEPKLCIGLSKLSNVILTPHIASASVEAREEMATIAANNIIDYFEGRIPRNILNQ